MATGATAIWGRPYPLSTDAPNVHTDIQALANALETTPLYPTTAVTSRALIAGESVLASPSVTVTTSAAPTKGDIIQIIAGNTVTGATPVTVAFGGAKVVNGLGLSSATSFVLGAPGAQAKIQYDGTNWRLITGGQDTGWVTLVLSNATAAGSPWYTPQARGVGDRAWFRGAATQTAAGAVTLTLPTGTVPASQAGVIVLDWTGNIIEAGTVHPAGTMNTSATAGHTIVLDGLSYSTV